MTQFYTNLSLPFKDKNPCPFPACGTARSKESIPRSMIFLAHNDRIACFLSYQHHRLSFSTRSFYEILVVDDGASGVIRESLLVNRQERPGSWFRM